MERIRIILIKHKRRGHLFQGRYKAIPVEADSYAGELFRYVHLNPVRGGLIDLPEKYRWSSYQFYVGEKKKPEWLSIDFILGYYEGGGALPEKRYQEFVNAKLYGEYESPLKETTASTILGAENFIENVQKKYLNKKRRDRDLPALGELAGNIEIGKINSDVNEVLSYQGSLAKKVTKYLCHQYSGMKLKDIEKHFNVSESAVSEASRQFHDFLKENETMRNDIESIRKKRNLWNV